MVATKALTLHQARILALLARGLSNAQIAECLQMSERSIAGQVTVVLDRCGLTGRHQAAAVPGAAG